MKMNFSLATTCFSLLTLFGCFLDKTESQLIVGSILAANAAAGGLLAAKAAGKAALIAGREFAPVAFSATKDAGSRLIKDTREMNAKYGPQFREASEQMRSAARSAAAEAARRSVTGAMELGKVYVPKAVSAGSRVGSKLARDALTGRLFLPFKR